MALLVVIANENDLLGFGEGGEYAKCSDDFAGAWAVDANGDALLPTVPPNPLQRIYALRAGVNIMMYMLTGNYKSDQVHVPVLLERLGQ